jgi:YD repeat-containing protein
LPASGSRLFLFPVLLFLGNALFAQEAPEDLSAEEFPVSLAPPAWYLSNASGMALARIPSRAAALRNNYSLSVEKVLIDDAPEILVPYWDPSFSLELRVLFENGAEIRCQWIFRGEGGTARLNASGSGGFFGGASGEDGAGFIEVYNAEGFITEERQFAADGSESAVRFFYNQGVLVKAESFLKERIPQADDADEAAAETPEEELEPVEFPQDGFVPAATDYYRYTRSGSLRAMERVYHAEVSGANTVRAVFPGITPGFSREVEFVNPGLAYSNEFFSDLITPAGTIVTYTTDPKGRVLREIRKDAEGNVAGEILNTWNGDRLESVYWKAEDDERLTKYEYDSEGNRITERDYRRGVLEKTVRTEGGRDIEELYLNGQVVLRAVWENGRKISEERVRAPR